MFHTRGSAADFLKDDIGSIYSGFNHRLCDVLQKGGIRTGQDLVLKTEAEIITFRGLGRRMLAQISVVLNSRGLKLGMTTEAVERILKAKS